MGLRGKFETGKGRVCGRERGKGGEKWWGGIRGLWVILRGKKTGKVGWEEMGGAARYVYGVCGACSCRAMAIVLCTRERTPVSLALASRESPVTISGLSPLTRRGRAQHPHP